MARKNKAPSSSKPPSTPHSTEITLVPAPIPQSATPPPYSSNDDSGASVPVSSSPDKKVPPTSSNQNINSKQELEWKEALENLERRIISYQNLVKEGKATEEDVEGVTGAFKNVADSHPDPKVKAHFNKKGQEFRDADPEEREEILKSILKGFVALLAAPFLAVGAALYTVGMILRGVGLGLKVTGQFALKNLWG